MALRAACLKVACSGGFLDACLSATLSSVLLNGGWSGCFYRPGHYNTEVEWAVKSYEYR